MTRERTDPSHFSLIYTILTESMSPGGTPHNSKESQSNINCEMLVGNLRELSIYPAIAQKSSFMRLAAITCQRKTLIFHP